ncbi:hypothetical protein [Microbispora sp. H10885]|uniref:hypothetical protein n=1 Tax=Microbispora sp. H10885 TaxID=2729110 RepID=UPI001C71AF27|nr:hypothetical protein [Microbispora sp. H10885]
MSLDKMARALGLPVDEVRQRIDAAAPKSVPQRASLDTTPRIRRELVRGDGQAFMDADDDGVADERGQGCKDAASADVGPGDVGVLVWAALRGQREILLDEATVADLEVADG